MMNADKHINGSGTLTFGNTGIAYAENIAVSFSPKHTAAPDVLNGAGPLGHSFDGADIVVTARVSTHSRDFLSMATGYHGNMEQVGGAQILNLDESVRTPRRGSLTVLVTQLDGTPVRLYLKTAECVPEDNSLEIAKGTFAGVTLRFVKVTPTDGTQVVGRIQFGDPT